MINDFENIKEIPEEIAKTLFEEGNGIYLLPSKARKVVLPFLISKGETVIKMANCNFLNSIGDFEELTNIYRNQCCNSVVGIDITFYKKV